VGSATGNGVGLAVGFIDGAIASAFATGTAAAVSIELLREPISNAERKIRLTSNSHVRVRNIMGPEVYIEEE
jgi:hypothetical protein